jgi:hypothetical protein
LTLALPGPATAFDFDARPQASAGSAVNAPGADTESGTGAKEGKTAVNAAPGGAVTVDGQLVERRVIRHADGALGRVLMAVAESDTVVVEWDNGDEEDLHRSLLRFL